jgi:hypothetical protein
MTTKSKLKAAGHTAGKLTLVHNGAKPGLAFMLVDGRRVGEVYGAPDNANAARVAKAVNQHDGLIRALTDIAEALEDARKNYGCTSEFCSGTCHFCANIRRARAALAAAGAEVGA